jgi:hypothetical protein
MSPRTRLRVCIAARKGFLSLLSTGLRPLNFYKFVPTYSGVITT